MNFGTMKREILEDAQLQPSEDAVTRKIIASIRHHRVERLWFSERSFHFHLQEGVGDYAPSGTSGLPSDLVEIVGDMLWVTLDGDDTQRYSIHRIDTQSGEDFRSYEYTDDQPFYWDFWAGTLRLFPTPDSSSHELEGHYVRDIGEPVARYEGGSWSFYTPDEAETLTDEYTSDWFQDSRDMVRHYALFLLYDEVLSNAAAAERALGRWAASKIVLQDESEGKTAGNLRIRPTLF